MSQQIVPFSISAPGFYGLNTSDSPVDLSTNFALEAINCVIDKSGRVASRKGWTTASTANTDLASSNITCIGELIENDGTATTICAGGGFLYKLSGTTLVTLTYGGGGVAPTISANNWQFCQLSGVGMFWQRGYDPLIYDPAVSTTTFRRLNEKAGTAGTIYQCNTAISAYGRVWAADTSTDKGTIAFSDLLTPHIWTGGTSGTLNLRNIWPIGGDEIVGLAAHNNRLFIFGKRQTLIYKDADTPSSMSLEDSLENIGCIARDSIQPTGEDVIFLSGDGVRSVQRTIQEKSAPMRNFSKNVHSDIQGYAALETLENVKAVYSPSNSFYLITFPSSAVTYCFDLRSPLQDGSARITTWTNIDPKAFCETRDKILYIGKAGYLGSHEGYYDNGANYRMSYFTTWIDFGNPIQTSILKKVILTLIGLSNQTVVFKWAYDFMQTYFSQTSVLSGVSTPAEYGTAEYGLAEYAGNVAINTLTVNGSSAGKVLQFGVEAQVGGYNLSIQRIDLYTKNGRLQ
jgi:hypothetical protein